MSIDSPAIPPAVEPKKNNKLLWGCLIAFLLVLVISCCAGSLLFLPLFSDYDPLGTNIRERLEEYIPLNYLEDPSSIPGIEQYLEENQVNPPENEPTSAPAQVDSGGIQDIPLSIYSFNSIGVTFSYPSGWDIEADLYTATFYDPDSYTYLYVGEDPVEEGTSAEEIALGVLDSVQDDAQEGSYQLLSSGSYSISFAEDAYLAVFEWIDQDGYYTWAYDLEIVSGESNIFFFLSGENPEEIAGYGDLLDIIAASLTKNPEPEPADEL